MGETMHQHENETTDVQGHEQDHDHGGGAQDDDHDHEHRPGILGWLQHTFAHSHDVHEKVDDALESNERGIWALKLSLLGLGATALFQVVIVYFSCSTSLLADTIHNFGDAVTAIPLWLAFALQRRERSRRFTYGYGRTEDIAGVIIVGLIFFSACVAGYESIRKLIDPQPISHLGWVAAAAIIGFIGNEAVAIFRIRVGREIGSAALIADGQHSRVDGFTSLAVLFGALGSLAGFPLADPIVGLLITIAILFIVKDTAVTMWHRLMDAIDPAVVESIERTAIGVVGSQDVHDLRVRWLGHKLQ